MTGLIAAVIVAADQISKFGITRTFLPGESKALLSPILRLTYVQNTGAAFGLFKGQQVVFITFAVVMIIWVFWSTLSDRQPPWLTRWGSTLILGGAVGNLIDRVRFGYVIDFIDFGVWPVFNVADSAITLGVGLLLWYSLTEYRASQKQPP